MKIKWMQRILSFVCAAGLMMQVVSPVYAASGLTASPEVQTQVTEPAEPNSPATQEPDAPAPVEPESPTPAEPVTPAPEATTEPEAPATPAPETPATPNPSAEPTTPDTEKPGENGEGSEVKPSAAPEDQTPATPDKEPEQSPEEEAADPAPEAESKRYTINPISNAGGSHNYSEVGGPATVVYKDQSMPAGGTLSMELASSSDHTNAPNLGMFYYYKDDNNFLYVGYDPQTRWYYQHRLNGAEKYAGLAGLPNLEKGVPSKVSVKLDGDTLTVTVKDKTATANGMSALAALQGSQIGVFSKSKTIAEFGNVQIDGKAPKGVPTMLVDANGTLIEGTIDPNAKVVVSGRVVDQDKKPVKDATAKLNDTLTATTDDNGNFKIADVPAGNYTLTISKDNYLSATQTVTVSGVDVTVNEIELSNADGKIWHVLENKAGYGGHNYANNNAPATAVFEGVNAKPGQTITMDFKHVEGAKNFGIFYYFSNNNDWLYIGMDGNDHWYYQWHLGGNEQYPGLTGLPAPETGKAMKITISLSQEVLSVQVNDKKVTLNDQNLLKLSEALKDRNDVKIGIMTKGKSKVAVSDLTVNGETPSGSWKMLNPNNGELTTMVTKLYPVTGKVLDVDKQPMEGAVIRAANQTITTGKDGVFTLPKVETGTYALSVSKPGYQAVSTEFTVKDGPVTIPDVTLKVKEKLDLTKYDLLENGELKAWVGKDFPFVAQYEMKGADGQPAVFLGQAEKMLKEVSINGTKIATELVGKPVINKDSKTYVLHVQNDDKKINLDMTVEIKLEGASLAWRVTNIDKKAGCGPVDVIDVPDLNLLTVTDLDAFNAPDEMKPYVGFDGALRSTSTTAFGDRHIGFGVGEDFYPSESGSYLYAFLSNGKLSAGLWSNSEMEKDNRVKRNNGADCISLTSAPWYYEHGDVAAQAYAYNTKIGDRESLVFPKSELPQAKVSFAADANGDKIINWNDGAIAFRQIYNVPMGAENTKDLVNHRIVMNFASMAPNPYLKTADNIRKVYLATDGLPQSVVLKGYGNEGHDSANSEYADIAEREGGVEDFRKLIQIAHKYDTEVGVHVNAQEAYPESKSFSDRMLGHPYLNIGNGWGWLDQSHVIDKIWDLTSNSRWKRLVQFYDRINGTNFNTNQWPTPAVDPKGTVADMATLREDAKKRPDNMDFIYLDVWYQDSWETRRIAEQFNSLGWRFTTEFSDQGEYDSTWQHWATDATYGGSGMKGFNSEIIRFIRNDQRDSQVLNYPEFGGTADNPLLGGYRLYGFEGWGGDQDFNRYIEQTFLENIPTRFLQHYQVTKWVDYSGKEGDVSPVGNQEKEITLQDAKGNTVVVTRNATQRDDSIIERTITLNGDKVLDDDAYLLPWSDYQNEQDKLYHFNWDGGETTWTLTGSFKGATSLVCYELTDQGRVNPQTIAVNNGQITLNAQAKTPYVLVRNAAVKQLNDAFGDGNYVADPGFNGYADGESLSPSTWTGDINNKAVTVRKAPTGEQNLVFDATAEPVEISTTIRGLVPGEDYVAEIYVDNQSDSRATISVNTGKKDYSNYTMRSFVGNYVGCDENHLSGNYPSKLQRIQVPFVAEKDTAVFTLAREAGEGTVAWNDIRIVKIKVDNFQKDGSFKQDFESVVQGLYPFVLGPAQGVTDPRTHLAQLNAPYTQSGWNNKVLDDVISGNWSLKHHENNKGIIYQTIPQNFRFEAGKCYRVEFDYQSGRAGAYAMAIGNGENYTVPTQFFPSTAGNKATTKHHSMNVIGDASGQTWIGLYCNGQAAGNDMGERDFILDNLTIREMTQEEIDKEIGIALNADKTELFVGETAKLSGVNLKNATWSCSDNSVIKLDPKTMTVGALKEGTATITVTRPGREAATAASVTINVSGGVVESVPVKGATVLETINGQDNANAVVDGNLGTAWDGKWDSVTKDNPAGFIIDLGKEMEATGFRIRQRGSWNANGRIYGYRYSFGTKYDETKKEITDGKMSDWIATPDDLKDKGDAWIPQKFATDGSTQKVRYIKVEAHGTGDNLTISELDLYNEKPVADKATVENLTIEIGESAVLKASPVGNTLLKGLVWSTKDTSIIRLTESGRVTGLAAGTATVTVSNAAGLEATGTVTVKAAPTPPQPDQPDQPDVKPDVKPQPTVAPTAKPKPTARPASKPSNKDNTEVEPEDLVYVPVESELTEVPEALAKLEEVNTVEKIGQKLHQTALDKLADLLKQANDGKIDLAKHGYPITGFFPGLTLESFLPDNFELRDVKLTITEDGKEIVVTRENFPKDGVTIVLPYPEGTSSDSHVFMVTHMLTEKHNGLKPGDVEMLPVKALPHGLQVTVTSLSPIGISWAAKPADVEPSVTEPETNDVTAPVETETSAEGSSNMMLWIILAVVVVLAVVAFIVIRRRNQQED